MRQISAFVLLTVLYAFLLCGAGTFYGMLDWRQAALLHLLQWSGALGGAWLLWNRPLVDRRWGRAAILAASGLILWVMAAPLHVPQPRFAWPALLALPGACGWALIAAEILALPRNCRWAGRASAFLVLVLALWSYWAFRAGVTVRPSLPLGHHNFLAGTLVALLGPSVALLFTRRTADRALGGCSLVLGVMTLAGTSSLSGAAGAMGATLAGGLLWWRQKRRRRHHPGAFLAVFSALACVGLLIFLTPGGARIFNRAQAVLSGANESDTSLRNRIDYSRGALRGLVAERPFQGFGTGSVAVRFPLYRVQRNEPEEVGKIVTQLHCTPTHLLFEQGAIGASLALLLALLLLHRAWAAGQRDETAWPRRAGALVGLVAYLVASLGDYQMHVAALPATLGWLLGMALGAQPPPAAQARARFAPRLLALLLVGSAGAAGWRQLSIDRAHRAWDLARFQTDPVLAEPLLRRALALDPAFAFYQQTLAELLPPSAQAAEQILILRLNAAEQLPHAPLLAARAGKVLLEANRAREARDWLRLAVALEQASPIPWFFLGCAEEALGHEEEAIAAWGQALRLEPSLRQAHHFSDPERRDLLARLAECLDGSPALPPPPPTRPPVSAMLHVSHDEDPWRSTAAFVYRRQGRPGTDLEVPLGPKSLLGDPPPLLATDAARILRLPATAQQLLAARGWSLPGSDQS